MNQTCRTCRHWDRIGRCVLITPGGVSGTHLAGIATDDVSVCFLTAPTFGCTEHEPPDDAA